MKLDWYEVKIMILRIWGEKIIKYKLEEDRFLWLSEKCVDISFEKLENLSPRNLKKKKRAQHIP